MFLAFLGCDGSGKSAVVDGVLARLKKDGVPVVRGHWRPRAFGSNDEVETKADNPHGERPRGLFLSVLKLGWLWLNWWTGWYRNLQAASTEGVVVFNRYHADIMVDPQRYRYGGPMCLAKATSLLMPQPDLVILLDANPDILLARKREIATESLAVSRSRYLALCANDPKFLVIDAAEPLISVIDAAHEAIQRRAARIR